MITQHPSGLAVIHKECFRGLDKIAADIIARGHALFVDCIFVDWPGVRSLAGADVVWRGCAFYGCGGYANDPGVYGCVFYERAAAPAGRPKWRRGYDSVPAGAPLA